MTNIELILLKWQQFQNLVRIFLKDTLICYFSITVAYSEFDLFSVH